MAGSQDVTDPAVPAFIAAINDRDLPSWADRGIFTGHGHMEVETGQA